MCFDPVTMAIMTTVVTAASSMVSQGLQMNAQNKAAAQQYNQQSKYAESVNRAAIAQQQETDARNRLETMRNSESAADKTRSDILANQRAQATARASAGTSGMMGLPLNLISQNYQAMIGNQATNLNTYNTQLDQNYFYNAMNSAMQANSTSNQAVPMKPYMQSMGFGNFLSAGLQGAQAGMGAYSPGPKQPSGGLFGGGSSAGNATPLPPVNNFNPSF